MVRGRTECWREPRWQVQASSALIVSRGGISRQCGRGGRSRRSATTGAGGAGDRLAARRRHLHDARHDDPLLVLRVARTHRARRTTSGGISGPSFQTSPSKAGLHQPAVDNEQLLAFIRAGTNSHVHQTVNNEDTWYIRHDLLQPLEELPGFQEVWDQTRPPRTTTPGRDGHVYSLSWYTDPMAMYYNKQLVVDAGLDPENPPATYSEYLEWAAALTKDTNGDGQPDQWFISPRPSGKSGGTTSSSTIPSTSRPRAPISDRQRRHEGDLQHARGPPVIRARQRALPAGVFGRRSLRRRSFPLRDRRIDARGCLDAEIDSERPRRKDSSFSRARSPSRTMPTRGQSQLCLRAQLEPHARAGEGGRGGRADQPSRMGVHEVPPLPRSRWRPTLRSRATFRPPRTS